MQLRSHRKKFRLLDLPAELREAIYEACLCSFTPASARRGELDRILDQNAGIACIQKLSHNINIGLLRTCRKVYQEGWDVMVKRNRFVRVTFTDAWTKLQLVKAELPVITMTEKYVFRFKGYVMHVTFNSALPSQSQSVRKLVPAMAIMMLSEHLPILCQALPIFWRATRLSIRVGHRAPQEFYQPRNVVSLLRPIETHVRGITDVRVQMPNSQPIADQLVRHVKVFRHWEEFQPWLAEMKTTAKQCWSLHSAGKHVQASKLFEDLADALEPHVLFFKYGPAPPSHRSAYVAQLSRCFSGNAQCYDAMLRQTMGRTLQPGVFDKLCSGLRRYCVMTVAVYTDQPWILLGHPSPPLSVLRVQILLCGLNRIQWWENQLHLDRVERIVKFLTEVLQKIPESWQEHVQAELQACLPFVG